MRADSKMHVVWDRFSMETALGNLLQNSSPQKHRQSGIIENYIERGKCRICHFSVFCYIVCEQLNIYYSFTYTEWAVTDKDGYKMK